MPFNVLWLPQADIDTLGIPMLGITDGVERGRLDDVMTGHLINQKALEHKIGALVQI